MFGFNVKLVLALLLFTVVTNVGSFAGGYNKGHRDAKTQCELEKQRAVIEALELEKQKMQDIIDAAKAVEDSILKSADRLRTLNKNITEAMREAKFNSNPECSLTPAELQALVSAYRVRDGIAASPVSVEEGSDPKDSDEP